MKNRKDCRLCRTKAFSLAPTTSWLPGSSGTYSNHLVVDRSSGTWTNYLCLPGSSGTWTKSFLVARIFRYMDQLPRGCQGPQVHEPTTSLLPGSSGTWTNYLMVARVFRHVVPLPLNYQGLQLHGPTTSRLPGIFRYMNQLIHGCQGLYRNMVQQHCGCQDFQVHKPTSRCCLGLKSKILRSGRQIFSE